MSKRSVLLVTVLIALVLIKTVQAQDPQPPQPQHSDPNWQAAYWNNTTLSGSAVLQRSEASLNYDWGTGSPDGTVNSDQFSARWTRYIEETPGTYRFTVTSDDGIRVWVDGALIIDQWYDHPAQTFSADKYLSAGHHLVTVDFYENTGYAVARLSWALAPTSITNWRGEYYNNTSLSGSPAVVRDDASINFDWSTGSPAGGIAADGFSVRWTRNLSLPAGTYRFAMTVDDGGRLWVNNVLLIDTWWDQAPTTYTGDISLPGGSVPIKMEYYENGGLAVAKLSWALVSTSITNWRGEYFNNTSLSGSPALVRDDANINFDWGTGSPAGGIVAEGFSARWTRDLNLPAGTYRFTMTVDDGGRLWVGSHLLIDAWWDQSATTYTGDLYLPGGSITVKMEYYENTGAALARLSWDPASSPSTGTVIVDDSDPGFVEGGAGTGWRYESEGHNGTLTWTRNNDWARAYYNWARWYPSLAARQYEVFVYIPERYTTTSAARYWVSHAGGYTLRIVNQSTNGNQWVSLGTYTFRGTSTDHVSLSDVTYEVRRTRLIGFDAVKWVPR